jgi:type VI protein secretion system component VasK
MFKFLVVSFRIVLTVFAVGLCSAGYYYGRTIPFAQQWPLYEALRTTASIIFAVVGAWLAIIYPERLKLSFREGKKSGVANGNLGLLLTPAIHSTIILVLLLLIGICAPLLKSVPELRSHVELFRGISFVTLTILTLWQITIVVMTLFPAETIQAHVAKEAAKEEIEQHYGKLHRK